MCWTSVGLPHHAELAFEARVTESVKAFGDIAQMTHTHRAATVLAFTGRGLATYSCRTSLPPRNQLLRLDAAFAQHAASIYGVPHDSAVIEQLHARYTEGGFGYRRSEPYARLAYIASVVETSATARSLFIDPSAHTRLGEIPFVRQALADVVDPSGSAFSPLTDEIRLTLNAESTKVFSRGR